MSLVVDLNADLGEGAGHDDELLALVTSANIACGFHAGDAETMRRSIETARDHKVAVGGHPSLFDRENFGRKELSVRPDEIFADRNYLSDGSLVPRTRSDALLHDPEEAAARVVRMLRDGRVKSVDGADVDVRAETVCVHGDTPGAVDFARVLKSRLEEEDVSLRAPKFRE